MKQKQQKKQTKNNRMHSIDLKKRRKKSIDKSVQEKRH